ncbi:MAG: hypothetical protein JSR00_03315 [Bacteroidetes bacterium]|nr:hypothetical protein [Bacteroidota bacterium]
MLKEEAHFGYKNIINGVTKICTTTGVFTHFPTRIALVLLRNSFKIGLTLSTANLIIFLPPTVSLRNIFRGGI